MGKSKSNVQYTSVGSDKPAIGDFLVWNGNEFVPGPKRLIVWRKPTDLARTDPWLNCEYSRLGNGQIQIMNNIVVNTLLGYNATTGIWTCPESGYYFITFFTNYSKRLNNDYGWYDPNVTGSMEAGICSPTDYNAYVTDYLTLNIPLKHITLSGSTFIYIPVNTQLCLKVINTASSNYDSGGQVQLGDIARMSIVKI